MHIPEHTNYVDPVRQDVETHGTRHYVDNIQTTKNEFDIICEEIRRFQGSVLTIGSQVMYFGEPNDDDRNCRCCPHRAGCRYGADWVNTPEGMRGQSTEP